jgi:hypothetical protein
MRQIGVRLTTLAAAFAALAASSVLAQSQPPEHPRGYVDGSVLATTRPAGPADYHYTSPMLGGTTATLALAAGFFASSHFSVGGEVQFVGALSGTQVFNHFIHFSSTVSDSEIYALAVVRVHLLGGPVRLVPLFVIGPAFGHREFTDRLDYSGYPEQASPQPDASFSRTYLLIGGGAEVTAAVSRRVAFVGSFRLCTVTRDDDINRADFVGMRNLTVQAGAGLRWTF